MSRVFISYIAEDGDVAQAIASGLEAAGYRTWFYERDALPGEAHLTQTGRAIEQSAAYVVVVSDRSLSSPQIETELVHAHETGTPMVPVLVDLSFEELKQCNPMWRIAIGAAVALQVRRDAMHDYLPRLLAGLGNLGVRPTAEPQPKLLVRVSGFVNAKDGGFRLERLIGNDIGFGHVGDGTVTVHEACRDMISVLLAQSSQSGSAKRLEDEMVSVWTTNAEEVPRDQRINQMTPGSVVIAILNERRYPAEILKSILLNTRDLLR